MKRLLIAATLSLTASASQGYELSKVVPFDMPAYQQPDQVASLPELMEAIQGFNRHIGSYPPKLDSEEQREKVYQQWTVVLNHLKAQLLTDPKSERELLAYSELYRQGHNLDVKGAAELAMENIEQCLKQYPDSIPCNFSASYFYLSVNPQFAPKGEKALLHIQSLIAPRQEPEVERGLVFAYVYQKKKDKALYHLDRYLELHPGAEWALQFKTALQEGDIKDESQVR